MATTKVDVNLIGATGIGNAKVLQGDGTWVTPAGGAWEFVSTAVASSSANVSITGIDNTSDTWLVNIEGVNVATDVSTLRIRTSNDTSSHSYDSGASDYGWRNFARHSDADYKQYDDSDAEIEVGADPFTHGNDATNSFSGWVKIHAPSNTTYHTLLTYEFVMLNNAATPIVQHLTGVAKRHAAEAVTAVQFYMSSGNFDTGRFTLLKCKHS